MFAPQKKLLTLSLSSSPSTVSLPLFNTFLVAQKLRFAAVLAVFIVVSYSRARSPAQARAGLPEERNRRAAVLKQRTRWTLSNTFKHAPPLRLSTLSHLQLPARRAPPQKKGPGTKKLASPPHASSLSVGSEKYCPAGSAGTAYRLLFLILLSYLVTCMTSTLLLLCMLGTRKPVPSPDQSSLSRDSASFWNQPRRVSPLSPPAHMSRSMLEYALVLNALSGGRRLPSGIFTMSKSVRQLPSFWAAWCLSRDFSWSCLRERRSRRFWRMEFWTVARWAAFFWSFRPRFSSGGDEEGEE